MLSKGLIGSVLIIIVVSFVLNGPFTLGLVESVLKLLIECLNNCRNSIEEKRINMLNKQMIEDNEKRKVHSSRNEEICLPYSYRTRIINRNPFIIYIENFLSEKEINHLIEIGEPLLKPSMINNDHTGRETFSDYRTSTSAYINRHRTHIVRCLERRFSQFQGINDVEQLEPFQLVKYVHNQQYKPHFDWFAERDVEENGGQRLSTFFTYLQTNCSQGGQTEFVNVRFDQNIHQHFCDILLCDKKSSKHGLRFRPIPGNSIFWFNIDHYGKVDHQTHHAGLPPGQDSIKIGLNTWTRIKHYNWMPFHD